MAVVEGLAVRCQRDIPVGFRVQGFRGELSGLDQELGVLGFGLGFGV